MACQCVVKNEEVTRDNCNLSMSFDAGGVKFQYPQSRLFKLIFPYFLRGPGVNK